MSEEDEREGEKDGEKVVVSFGHPKEGGGGKGRDGSV